MDPQFFDFFGIGVFAFLATVGIVGLLRKKKMPAWVNWLIICIAIFGLVTDGTIIIKYLFLGG